MKVWNKEVSEYLTDILQNSLGAYNESGIYCILNISNCKYYIGSSVNIRRRLYNHRYSLCKNNHPNKLLQNAFNKYGVGSFKFIPLIYCPKDMLIPIEQLYLDYCSPNYNIRTTAESNAGFKMTDATKRLISKKLKGLKRSKEFREKMSEVRTGIKLSDITKQRISNSKSNRINCFSLNGRLIGNYNSILEASKALNIDKAAILSNVYGKNNRANNYIFEKYIEGKTSTTPYRLKYNRGNKRKIVKMTMESTELIEYDSIKEAYNDTNIDTSSISACCRGKRKSAGNFKWKYIN